MVDDQEFLIFKSVLTGSDVGVSVGQIAAYYPNTVNGCICTTFSLMNGKEILVDSEPCEVTKRLEKFFYNR